MSKKIFLSHRLRLIQLSLCSIFLVTGCTNDPKNAEPVAINSQIEVTEDEPKTAMMLAEDKDGDTLRFSIRNRPNEGELTILNEVTGQFEYKPNDNFSGEDQFTFRVSDGESEANATITIQVISVNDAPQAVNDSYTLDEGGSKGANLLDNDSDPDVNDSLTLSTTPLQGPSNGALNLQPDGRFTYTHNGSETTSDSFVYKITDSGGLTAQATVSLTINPVMDEPPSAVNDNYAVNEGAEISANLLDNDSDPDVGDSISLNLTLIQQPSNGSFIDLQSDGSFTYKHDGSETTSDSFKYEVTDTTGRTAQATVTLTINQVNDIPVADDDAASTNKGIVVDIDVLDGDVDPDGTINASTISIVNQPSGGVATVVNGKVRYTPHASFLGQDSFDYTVEDNSGAVSNTARVTVFVDHTNPVAEANCSFAAKQTQQVGMLKASDGDSVDTNAMTFKLGANGEINTGQWLSTNYGRVRITNETTGAFEFDLTDNSGLGKRDEFNFQVSVLNEMPDSATQSLVIEPRIMPLGDSITDGINYCAFQECTSENSNPAIEERNGYRKSLYSLLSGSNYKIDFVGSKTSGNGVDNNHEGNPGWPAEQIRDNVGGFLNSASADIILLHIGTNDLNVPISQDPNGIKNEVQGILSNINSWASGKNITVLVAKIIDFNPSNSKVAELNNLVTAMVNSGNWSNLTVSMVDQYGALNNRGSGGDWGDELHPSAQGYNKMASRWMSALTPVLEGMCNQ